MLPLLTLWAVVAPAPPQQPASAWHTVATSNLTIRWQGEQPFGVIASETWDEARQRYPPHTRCVVDITIAPDTTSFRQLTRQPGWMLASTQGNRIVTQPAATLQSHGGAHGVLMHEMLHVLVDADTTAHTPLWLREGLVEVLAGETASRPAHVHVADIDRALQHRASWAESQAAHRAAAALVSTLVAHYGIGAVRGWLTTGVPAGVVAIASG